MATLINGNGNPAIYAQQDADFYNGIMGPRTRILNVGSKMAATIEDANTIAIADGVIITKEGRRVQVDVGNVDEFIIPTGQAGTTRYYIIGYHLYTDGSANQLCETFVQLMASGSETITEDEFREGATEVYVSLYRIEQTGLTLNDPEALLTVGDSVSQIEDDIDDIEGDIAQINSDLTELDGDVSSISSTVSSISSTVSNLSKWTYPLNIVDKRLQTIDLLGVNVTQGYNSDANLPYVFGSDNTAQLINTPLPAPFYGIRYVICSPTTGNHLTTVYIIEQYPVAGRIWSNTFDMGAGTWYGWHCTVMNNQTAITATVSGTTSANGNINLNLNTSQGIIVSVNPGSDSLMVIPYFAGTQHWAHVVYVNNITTPYVGNITLRYWYIPNGNIG